MALAGFSGGSSSGGATDTIESFRDECGLDNSRGGLSGLIDMGVSGAKCDDRRFVLRGSIVSQIRRNDYVFKDDSGTVTVEITKGDFGGRDITPDNVIKIFGEADYDDGELILEVSRLEVVK